ncbi:MAG: molybdopterin-guanine dinucleotide biosynthesis protein B [Kiritimatiellaeota bacterium]|nr:molybdopterin-guanine dinucleotide biosynthesis protein B [Kiritimatiellota bacterium]
MSGNEILPVIALCGWSGSGKTTLLEQVVPRLREAGWTVAVLKHDVHGLRFDKDGKDSDRLFQQGADVLMQGGNESFFRRHMTSGPEALAQTLRDLVTRTDVVLVEGHKGTPLPKIWLSGPDDAPPPKMATTPLAILPPGPERSREFLSIVVPHITKTWLAEPLAGCVLAGGQGRRMKRPKHLLRDKGRSWAACRARLLADVCSPVVFAAGRNSIPDANGFPVIPDAPDAAGPLAGILAAMRWAPFSSWVTVACDMPSITQRAVEWLLGHRRPGVWGVFPVLPGEPARPEPLFAYYNFRLRSAIESLVRTGTFAPRRLADHPHVLLPRIPEDIASAWTNANTPEEVASTRAGATDL